MRDYLRKILVCTAVFGVIGSVWAIAAVKAHLDGPYELRTQVDPAIMRELLGARALAIDGDGLILEDSADVVADSGDLPLVTYWFAG